MRNILFSLLSIFLTHTLLAQSNFSETFFGFPHNIHIFIPSHTCVDNEMQSGLTYKSYLGKLSVIRTYYADLNVNIHKTGNNEGVNRKHVTGLGIYNDREGDFFNKIRVMGRYGLHLPLKKNLYFSSGVSLHWVNYNFHTPSSSISGSDFSWAGTISCSLYSEDFSLGVSVNDFNNPTLRPIAYEFLLRRFITTYAIKKLKINDQTELKGAGRFHFYSGTDPAGILQLGLVFRELAGVSALYYTTKGIGVMFDLQNIKLLKNYVHLSFAYLVPGRNVYPAASQYELNLMYSIIHD